MDKYVWAQTRASMLLIVSTPCANVAKWSAVEQCCIAALKHCQVSLPPFAMLLIDCSFGCIVSAPERGRNVQGRAGIRNVREVGRPTQGSERRVSEEGRVGEGSARQEICVVVSVNQACCDRIKRLCLLTGYLTPEVVTDPAEVRQLLERPAATAGPHRLGGIASIILDLASPPPDAALLAPQPRVSWGSVNTKETGDMIARTIAVAIAIRGTPTLPLLVISAIEQLDQAFQRVGLPLTSRVAPDADDTTWERAWARLTLAGRNLESMSNQSGHVVPELGDPDSGNPASPPGALRLHHYLWLDLDGCTLRRNGRIIPLTGREVALLTLLCAAPHRYIRTREIAQRLARPGMIELDEHSIEQTVSTLRCKLGESGRSQRTLRTCYGIGYGLFPEDA